MKTNSAGKFYELLDFGYGRRLERFGELVLDRPCPVAEDIRPHTGSLSAGIWENADSRFIEMAGTSDSGGERGNWEVLSENGELVFSGWTISPSLGDVKNPINTVKFELKGTPFGHIGLFPEQLDNWNRIAKYCQNNPQSRVLNLFGYTGGSTLAAAATGAETTHLDAAKNIVHWARRNAELSGLADSPTRWIAEDARKFVKRELKRGNRYDLVILDPPSYGHGSHGEVWRLSKHLSGLLSDCFALLEGANNPAMLLTWHTKDYDLGRLERQLFSEFTVMNVMKMRSFAISLQTKNEAILPCGYGISNL